MNTRSLIARGLHRSGALRMIERVSRSFELRTDEASGRRRISRTTSGRFAILCYHRIGVGGIPFYSELPASAFERQMRYLREHYRLISLGQLLQEIGDVESTSQGVTVTFDDGYRGLHTEALPILERYRIPATVYLTAGAIESGEPAWYDRVFLALQVFPGNCFTFDIDPTRTFHLPTREARKEAAVEIVSRLRKMPDQERRVWCAALEKRVQLPAEELDGRMLDWEQVRTMQRAGTVFGAHTVTHPVLTRLKPQEVIEEATNSRRMLEERLQESVPDFAYPFGQPADCGGLAELIEKCGFRSAVTTMSGINRTGANPFELRRPQLGCEGSLALFAFDLARLFVDRTEYDHPSMLPSLPGPATIASGVRHESDEVRPSA